MIRQTDHQRNNEMPVAAGDGIKSGKINNGHILDPAPAILTMLGQQVPPEMEGRVLPFFKE